MTDLRTDNIGDIWWENGLIDTVSGDAEDLQRLQDALETGLGEWAFDTSEGVPYLANSQSRAGNDALIEGAIRAISDRILGDNSVLAIEFIRDPAASLQTINVDTVKGGIQVRAIQP